jgi:anti-anti-sigma factor
MAFESTLEMSNGVAKITLGGELDAGSAPQFKSTVEAAAAQSAKRIALIVPDLEYISSAGLRVLVFARQKMGSGVDIYLIGAQEQILDPIKQSGLLHSLYTAATYDAGTLEKF